MEPSHSTREMYPHREVGLVLLLLGILMFIVAVVLGSYCDTTSYSGPPYPSTSCLYPYAPGAVLLGVLGFVLIIVGLVLVTQRNPATVTPVPYSGAGWMPYYPLPPPPPAPMIACKSCGRVYTLGQFGFCPNCGSKLGA
jgi:uncharacterized membrane protein